LEILLELGIIGLILFAALILGFIYSAKKKIAFIAIVIAFIVQWNFFSGLPNALHIYLILAVLFATIKGAYEKERTFINIQNSNDDFVNITHYFLLSNMFPFRVNFKHHTIVIGEDYVFNTKDVYAAIKDIKGNVLS
jgi:predicted membrane protein